MKAPLLARKLHKWIALIIGVQVLFWMVSGAYMARVHVDFIHGDSLVKNVNRPIDHNLPLLYSVSAVLEQFPGAIRVDLVSRLDEPHYIVTHESSTALLNAITGETVSPVGEDTAIELTEYYYAGEGVVSNAILLTDDSEKPYDELSKGDIVLPSNCGGGTCGLCVVSLSPDAAETLADLKVVPEHARRQGVRLYCQAEVTYDMSVVTSDKALSAESHIYHSSKRRIDFWYGGRSRKDLFYVGDFDELETKFANFNWQPVLSEPQENDDWIGPTGFVHLTARDSLLTRNRHLSSCEFYICGPLPMLAATRQMITEFGVPESRVFFDDFGI